MTKTRLRLPLALLTLVLALPALPARPVSAATEASRPATLKNRRKVRAVLRRKGLSKLPGADGALAGRSRRRMRHASADVIGTPPALVSIPGGPIGSLFWQPGVLEAIAGGTASPAQCGQFFSGTHDGDSGGLGACHMAEGVGYSFSYIIDNSLCYMKRVPTPANVAAGGFTLVSGEFPGGDVTRLFSVPAGATPRVVKVAVTGQKDGSQNVFLRVASEDENTAAGNLYAVDLWFCKGGAAASGYDRIRISNAGELTTEDAEGQDADANVANVSGFVTFQNGEIVYDVTRNRRASVAARHSGGGFKADLVIAPDNTITNKSYETFGSGGDKSYAVASFSGSGADSLRFLAGAFKERQVSGGPSSGEVAGSTEFRTTFYAASPGSALESRLGDVDIDSDGFYATPAAPSVDASAYSCDATPDVAVTLDFANPALAPVQDACEHRQLQNMHFCHDDAAVQAAQSNFATACGGPH